MDDQLAFLRDHGVEVETREDREKAARGTADGGGPKFAFVRIPADSSEDMEEIYASGKPEGGDVLPELLKSRFADGSALDEGAVRAQAASQFGEMGAKLDVNSFAELTKGGSVETFSLVHPDKSNDYCGVYVYLDEVGVLKGLPRNARAAGLAEAAGKHGVSFQGDVFVGRVATQPSPMRNVSLKPEELSSSAAWLRRAAAENAAWDATMADLRGGGAGGGGEAPSGEGEGYRWSQGEEDCEVSVPLPAGTKAKEVKVVFEARRLRCTVAGEEVLQGRLYAAVRPDECSWSVAAGELQINLEKIDAAAAWPALFLPAEEQP
eukprot:CAMPEP_0170162904 /NCGR_PEP_ID=MMETSP0033_2-20121228/77327_1 /TAXON_ID=195969 /ORGANISM="Dolichomastix tenuilepis, Strain CCMP3274" /LENGTH=320 /DNA_ID=CAMNT_0010400535 /DNA_START=33 /DNA_END=995 /DNA_ORIENTATION=+